MDLPPNWRIVRFDEVTTFTKKPRDLRYAEYNEVPFVRQSILKRAFSGKLVPQDPNDEPASVLLEKIRDKRDNKQPKRKRGTIGSKTVSSAEQMSLPIN